MPIEAELFDGTVLEFPDDTEPSIVQSKAKELTFQRQGKPYFSTIGADVIKRAFEPPPVTSLPPDYAPTTSRLNPGRISTEQLARGIGEVGQRITPFPGLVGALSGVRKPGTLPELVNPMPEVVTSAFSNVLEAIRSRDPSLAKDVEAVMAVAPFHGPPVGSIKPALQAVRSTLPFPRAAPATPTINDLIAQQRPGLPAPSEVRALPAPSGPRALPEPEMVMQATPPLETPGGATIASEISRAPKRTIVDLVDEIKADIKDRVIQELATELKAGRLPPKTLPQAPKLLAAPEKSATIAPESTQAAPARVTPQPIPEVAPAAAEAPAGPKIVMGKSGYRGAEFETKPKFSAATPIEDVLPPRVAKAPYRANNKEVEAMADSKIRELVNVEGPVEFKGKTYTGAIREGNDVRLKDQPDKVLKKAEDILQVEEKVPFDIPPAQAAPFDPSRLKAAVQLDDGETIVGTVGRGGHKDIFEALSPQSQQRVKATGFFDPTDPNPKNFYADSRAAEQAYNARAGIETAPVAAPTRKIKGPNRELVEVQAVEPTNKQLFDSEFNEFARKHAEANISMTKTAPTFQQTEAGKQAVIPGAEGRKVPSEPHGLTGLLKSEKGALTIGQEDPLAAIRPEHEMGKAEVARRSFINRVDPTIRKMGPAGKKFANELQDFYYASEQRKAAVAKKIDDIFDKYPHVENTLMQRLESGGKGTAAEVAAYREIKVLTDEIGNEAASLKIKVKNPITGMEREFIKREKYAPHIIDPNKVAKNPTRLLDQIQEELIADGVEPGAARTQATIIVRNMSRKSGNLQFIRTQPKLDPDIHITNAREAYKRAAVGEVERIEALKRFGTRDSEGLLGNELGGIRSRTADISAEAGPDAAQKAELWARRQMGIPETPDPTMKSTGQLMRNFNTLKLGFLPVTNLAAQAPQILAAGKTTRFHPIKALEALKESFGKRGGYELARVYGTAIDNMSEDLLKKIEMSPRGPGGKAATAFLHITGGTKSENYVAKLAAYVGHEDAKSVIQTLLDNPKSASAAKAARNYGLSPEKVLKEGMTEENVFRAARHFTDETLLRGNVLNLPGAYTSESGKVFLQFKRATQMLATQMYDAARNDPAKFVALVAASQLGGEALEDIKAGVRGTVAAVFSGNANRIKEEIQRRPEGVRRIINNFAAAVTLGYLGDTLMDLWGGKDPKSLISGISVAFSPMESAFNVLQGAGRIVRGEAEKDFPKFRDTADQQIARAITREVPGGTYVRGLTYSANKTERQKFAEELGLKRESVSRAQMKKQLGLNK